MKRITFHLMTLLAVVANVSSAQTGSPSPRRQPGAPSQSMPRLQRDTNGRIQGQQWREAVNDRPAQKAQNARTLPDTRRQAGTFSKDAPKRGAGQWDKVDPRSSAGKGRSVVSDPRRQAGTFSKDAPKPGGGQWDKVDPRNTAGKRSPRGGRNPITKKPAPSGRAGKLVKGAGALGVGTAGLALVGNSQQLDADLRAGRITQAQYNRAMATSAVDAGATLLAIKKMTPGGMAADALVGTDPFSLGADAVGDIINGTNNAERSLQRAGKRLEEHGKGVEKLVTNPEGWAKDTERNINNEVKKAEKSLDRAGKDVGKAVDQAGRDVDKLFKGLFGG